MLISFERDPMGSFNRFPLKLKDRRANLTFGSSQAEFKLIVEIFNGLKLF